MAAVGFGALTEAIKLSSPEHTLAGTAPGAAIAATFVVAGLLTRRRQPDNATGMLLVLVGFCLLAEDIYTSTNRVVYTLGAPLHALSVPALVWVALAFPSGRLARTWERGLVVLTLIAVVFIDQPGTNGLFFKISAQDSLVAVIDSPTALKVLHWTRLVLMVLIATAVAMALARRWYRSSRPARRVLTPFLTTAVALAIVFVLETWPRFAARSADETLFRTLELTLTIALPLAVLLGIMRLEIAGIDATQAVRSLGSRPALHDVRAALSQALSDSSLRILRTSADGRLEDESDRPVELEPAGVHTVALERDGRQLGVLVHDVALRQDDRLLETVRSIAVDTLDQLERVREAARSRERLAGAVARERHRIERDLHDGAQQRLVAMALWLDVLKARLEESGGPPFEEVFERLARELEGALEELRALTNGTVPAILVKHGLDAALRALADRSPGAFTVRGETGAGISPATAAAAYFGAAEGVTNAIRHSGASEIELVVSRDRGRLLLEVRDDGIGGASMGAGTGLRGLLGRLEDLGGGLDLVSPAGGGTVLRIELPGGDDENRAPHPSADAVSAPLSPRRAP